MAGRTIHNFGRNISFTPAAYAEPQDEADVLKLLSEHRGRTIRVVASRHAWSDAILTDGLLISVANLQGVRINRDTKSVRVGAGCQIKHLLRQLAPQGLTLPSLGLIDEQSIAGATATGTHGSGKHSLSHYIRRVRVAHYDAQTGEPTISEFDSGLDLLAARCSLGLIGVILELELEARPNYRILEYSQVYKSLETVLAAEKEYPLQQFFLMPWSWQWLCQHRAETTQPRSRLAGLYRLYWRLGVDWLLHFLLYLLVKIVRIPALIRAFYRLIVPWSVIRNWRVIDDSHPTLTMQHELFRHIEIEFFVTRSNLNSALDFVRKTINAYGGQAEEGNGSTPSIPSDDRGSYCHHYPICIRRVLVDDTLVSMASPAADANREDWYAISLICYQWPSERDGFFKFAKFLAVELPGRFQARCHWGKFNPLDRKANDQLYPRMNEFRTVVRRYDPESRFANAWLRKVVVNDLNAE